MTGLYIIIIILTVFLILSVFLKANIHFRYEIIGMDTIKSYINISIFKFIIYEKETKNTVNELLNTYIEDNKKKKEKINLEVNDTKETFKSIIKQISKEKINLTIRFGIQDSILPVYAIPTFATILSLYLVTHIKEKYIKNIHYNIYPDYFHTYILVDAIIKFRLFALIKMFYLKNKYKEEKNGKSSN